MSTKHLNLKPHKAKVQDDTGEAWWYEEGLGMAIMFQPTTVERAYMIEISWRAVRAALERKDKADD